MVGADTVAMWVAGEAAVSTTIGDVSIRSGRLGKPGGISKPSVNQEKEEMSIKGFQGIHGTPGIGNRALKFSWDRCWVGCQVDGELFATVVYKVGTVLIPEGIDGASFHSFGIV